METCKRLEFNPLLAPLRCVISRILWVFLHIELGMNLMGPDGSWFENRTGKIGLIDRIGKKLRLQTDPTKGQMLPASVSRGAVAQRLL